MKTEIDGFFSEDVAAFVGALAELESRLDPTAEPQMDANYRATVDAFERSCEACRRMESLLANEPETLKQVKAKFRETVCPILDRSWFFERARTKPRGYPGDRGLLSAIYDYVPLARGFVGYLDLFFLNTTLACGVRGRIECVKSFLAEELDRRHGDVSILNVACGPVREYEGGFGYQDEFNVQITCIDTDQETLGYVQSRIDIGALGNLNVKCVNHNAIRTSSAAGNIRRFGQPDIIYSIGLCDYIPDKYLVPMLQGWRETVCEGGTVYVAFKDSRKYSPTVYQWHVDWYFYQRTEDECRSLFERAGYDMHGLKMTRDVITGSIINFSSRIKKPAVVRIDRAEPQVAVPKTPAVREQQAVSNGLD